MHQLLITISSDLGFSTTSENLGKARKLRNSIARNGYEHEAKEGFMFYPPHRIQDISIVEIPEVKVVQEKKEEGENESS